MLRKKVINDYTSSSSDEITRSSKSSSNSESGSSEDNEAFDPEPSMSKDKKESHVTKYIERYDLRRISKKTRQDTCLNWPISFF